jgi:hypothetical protein
MTYGNVEFFEIVWFDCGTTGSTMSTAPTISKTMPTTTITGLIRTTPIRRPAGGR